MSTFGALSLPNRPNVPYLRSALVQIDEALKTVGTDEGSFSPFGEMEGFLMSDSAAEMVKSLRLPPSGIGLLRFDQERSPGLSDLPKLTASAARRGARPPKSEPTTFRLSPIAIKLFSPHSTKGSTMPYEDIRCVRLDRNGRFFVVLRDTKEAPPCFKATPWIEPALALLIAIASRNGTLVELQNAILRAVGGG